MELGQDFAFLERQKKISIDSVDYKLDLLFYHRRLHRLFAIDLKLGKFKPEFKGQMELYLKYLKKYEMQPDEEEPIGLLLCVEGNTPAREAHVLRNPNPLRNPWFILNGNEDVLYLSFFHFNKNEIRHY